MTRSRTNPLLSRGGVGVVLVKKINLLTNTTPSAPSTVASQHSIDGAATPPRLWALPSERSGHREKNFVKLRRGQSWGT